MNAPSSPNSNASDGQPKPIDASVIVKISSDKMSATLAVSPAVGGVVLSLEKLNDALEEAKISPNALLKEEVPKLLALNSAVFVPIAYGQAVIHGENVLFKPLIKKRSENMPAIEEGDRANYFSAEEYTSVVEGDQLMRRIPATDGVEGFDVTGKILKPKRFRC